MNVGSDGPRGGFTRCNDFANQLRAFRRDNKRAEGGVERRVVEGLDQIRHRTAVAYFKDVFAGPEHWL